MQPTRAFLSYIITWPGGTAEGGPPECLLIGKITGEEAAPGLGQRSINVGLVGAYSLLRLWYNICHVCRCCESEFKSR